MPLTSTLTVTVTFTPFGAWTFVDIDFSIVAANSLKMPASLPRGEFKHCELEVLVKDNIRGHELQLARTIDLPAGRVQPGDDYAKFQQFTRDADTALEREVALGR